MLATTAPLLVSLVPLFLSVTLGISVLVVLRCLVLWLHQIASPLLTVECVHRANTVLKARQQVHPVPVVPIVLIQALNQPMTACPCLLGSIIVELAW